MKIENNEIVAMNNRDMERRKLGEASCKTRAMIKCAYNNVQYTIYEIV